MEVSTASVTRTGSFRKRALEERKSLDMEVESLPTKHERAPSETDMDISCSPAKFTATTTSSTTTVHDEIEAHFQRSLAQVKQQQQQSTNGPPSTTLTLSTPSHPHRPLTAHVKPRVTASPSTPSHPPESHRIVVTLNNHVSSPANHIARKSPTISSTPQVNGVHVQARIPVKPVPVTGSSSFATPKHLPKIAPATTVHTVPMLTIPSGGLNSDQGGKNSAVGGTILSSVMTPQMIQQIMAQQSLAFLQQQKEQQQQQQESKQQQVNKQRTNPSQVPGLIQVSTTAAPSLKVGQIIDLTKKQLAGLPTVERSKGQSLPATQPNLILVPSDGMPVTMGTGAVRVVNPSAVHPQKRVGNKATSTLVTATTTQPTPAVTNALLSSPQVISGQGFPPMVVPMIDPATSQIVSGVSGGNQLVFLSTPPTIPVVQQQPLVLVNPDLSALQPVQSGIPPGVNLLSPGLTAIPAPQNGPGFILLSPGPNSTQFVPPLINMAPSSGAAPTTHKNSSPPPLKTTPPPLKPTRTANPRPKVPPLEPIGRRTSLDSISPGAEDNEDVMMTPASVEDHFAKALGEQWSKLQRSPEFSNHSRSVQAAQT